MNHRIWQLDVWGNDDDGYWVNDRMTIGYINLPDQPSDAHVIFRLQEEGIIANSRGAKIEDFWPDFNVTVNGKPILALEKMEDE